MSVAKASLNREVWGELISYMTLALVAVAVFYARGWFYLTGDIRAVIATVPDDTAYFYKIAWNVVNGKGLTFDGINLTNGFQPLWLYLLLPLAWLMRDATPEVYFRFALVYQTIIVLISGFVLFYAIRQVAATWVALATVSLFYLFGRSYFMNGMETGVLMLCLALLLAYSLRYRPFAKFSPRVAFGFGMLAGLLLLARLDMIFLLGVAYLAIFRQVFALRRHPREVKSLLIDIVVSLFAILIVVAPYFVHNKIVFGAFMPISGQLKNSFPQIVQPEFGLARFGLRDLLAVGVAALFSIGIPVLMRFWRNIPEKTQYFLVVTLISATTTLAHYLNTALFMKWAVFHWHFSSYYFTLCLIFCCVLILTFNRLLRHRHFFATAGAVVFALMVSLYAIAKAGGLHKNRGWHSVSYEAALWARHNTPSDAIFAMKDAGIFGLFSQRAVINLDGLVNTKEYQEALRQKRLNQYLAEKNVQYLVQHAMWDDMQRNARVLSGNYTFIEMPYRSRLYDTWSDPVRLYRIDEVFRKVYPEQRLGIDTVFIIWRLHHAYTSVTK